jgi:hypothetical protein
MTTAEVDLMCSTIIGEDTNVESRSASKNYDLKQIEELEKQLLPLQQVEVPLEHMFAPGVYARQVEMPADTFIIGHQHNTEHFNIILTGRASVMMDGVVHEVKAPAILKSGIGVRKILYIHETMRWITIHPTHETDVQRLEDMLVVKSDAFLHNQALKDIEQFKTILNNPNTETP